MSAYFCNRRAIVLRLDWDNKKMNMNVNKRNVQIEKKKKNGKSKLIFSELLYYNIRFIKIQQNDNENKYFWHNSEIFISIQRWFSQWF